MEKPAFTFIELMVSTAIIAIISVTTALTIQTTRVRSAFRNYETQIVHLAQQARSASLSNLRIGGLEDIESSEEVIHYQLAIRGAGVQLNAVGETLVEELGIVNIADDPSIEIGPIFDVYYFPPYGDVCFNPSCTPDPITEKTFTINSIYTDIYTEITIDVYGGFPEVEEFQGDE
jgi:prepilin-type N-terminal cleavage/methylation domain-containing protein